MVQKFVQYDERGMTARSDCLGTRYNRDRAARKFVIRVGACAGCLCKMTNQKMVRQNDEKK